MGRWEECIKPCHRREVVGGLSSVTFILPVNIRSFWLIWVVLSLEYYEYTEMTISLRLTPCLSTAYESTTLLVGVPRSSLWFYYSISSFFTFLASDRHTLVGPILLPEWQQLPIKLAKNVSSWSHFLEVKSNRSWNLNEVLNNAQLARESNSVTGLKNNAAGCCSSSCSSAGSKRRQWVPSPLSVLHINQVVQIWARLILLILFSSLVSFQTHSRIA